jgi:hypothetical protein
MFARTTLAALALLALLVSCGYRERHQPVRVLVRAGEGVRVEEGGARSTGVHVERADVGGVKRPAVRVRAGEEVSIPVRTPPGPARVHVWLGIAVGEGDGSPVELVCSLRRGGEVRLVATEVLDPGFAASPRWYRLQGQVPGALAERELELVMRATSRGEDAPDALFGEPRIEQVFPEQLGSSLVVLRVPGAAKATGGSSADPAGPATGVEELAQRLRDAGWRTASFGVPECEGFERCGGSDPLAEAEAWLEQWGRSTHLVVVRSGLDGGVASRLLAAVERSRAASLPRVLVSHDEGEPRPLAELAPELLEALGDETATR